MLKAIIADDEQAVLNRLKKLISWEELGIELVGEASDGAEELSLIREFSPDLVISDIMMPKMTGLEVIAALEHETTKPKFILISAHKKFSYAMEAVRCGAVDYLLKPVSRKELEASVRKAIGQMDNTDTAEVPVEEATEIQMLFEQIGAGHCQAKEELCHALTEAGFDIENQSFQGITIGLLEVQPAEFDGYPAEKKTRIRFEVFNYICKWFRENGNGFTIRKEEDRVHIVGIYPDGERMVYLESVVLLLKCAVERDYKVNLCVGLGMPSDNLSLLMNIYKTSNLAYELYYFEERPVIDFEEINKDYAVSFEDFTAACDAVFHSIMSKDGRVIFHVGHVMDLIREIHYGNKYAARSRTMSFTGDLGMHLYRSHMLEGDFYRMQDDLQHKVENLATFSALKDCVLRHYESLLLEIYHTVKTKDTVLIEDIKDYIRHNFNRDLSVKELAEIACVSPNYFSAMFKKETGDNYKAFLTDIRMKEALRLLMETDMKSYEIGEKVGYNNSRRFVDAFRDRYGVSPSEYRKNKRREYPSKGSTQSSFK